MSEMQMQQGFAGIIGRLKAEGQLTRNSGTNSLKNLTSTVASGNNVLSTNSQLLNRIASSINRSLSTLRAISQTLARSGNARSSSSPAISTAPLTNGLSRIASLIQRTNAGIAGVTAVTARSSKATNAVATTVAKSSTASAKQTRQENRATNITNRRGMLSRIGSSAGGAGNAALTASVNGLKRLGSNIRRAVGSVFNWGTGLVLAFGFFVNSPYWKEFKAFLGRSTKEGGAFFVLLEFLKKLTAPLEGAGNDLLKGDFSSFGDKIADTFIHMMNMVIKSLNTKLPGMFELDLIKTNKDQNKEKAATNAGKRLDEMDVDGKPLSALSGVEQLLADDPSTTFGLKVFPWSDETSKDIGGLMADSFIGDFGDAIHSIGRKITGTELTIPTMTDKQLTDRIKEIALMTDEEYEFMDKTGKAGATNLQMNPESLQNVDRLELLKKFETEANKRVKEGLKNPAPDSLRPVTVPTSAVVALPVPMAAPPAPAAAPKGNSTSAPPKDMKNVGVMDNLLQQRFN